MFGAILGDIVGSPYEFDRGTKSKDFPLFQKESRFTDDTVMTLAVTDALLHTDILSEQEIKSSVIRSMQKWGNLYPRAGYGGQFARWLRTKDPLPYGSWGNGSAMRVSAVGWLYDSLDTTQTVARWTAEVTHNHPEGIKGAQSVASAIWMARNGKTKDEIRDFIVARFGYDLDRTLDNIRPTYRFDVSCQGSVPQAILSFLEGQDFEDVIRNAVSLGGDTDTIAAIAGSMAEAYYGIPQVLHDAVMDFLPGDLSQVAADFLNHLQEGGNEIRFENPLITNWRLEDAIATFVAEKNNDTLAALLYVLFNRITMQGQLFVPVEFSEPLFPDDLSHRLNSGETGTLSKNVTAQLLTIQTQDNATWAPAFTGLTQAHKGAPSSMLPEPIADILERVLHNENLAGVMINPWSDSFALNRDLVRLLLDAIQKE